MEKFKKYDEIMFPDSRNKFDVIFDKETGNYREYTLDDLYKEVESINLNDDIPEDVKSQFNVAKNLILYTWFCNSFHQISEAKAFSTLEMALRKKFRLNEKKPKLRHLLDDAAESGLMKDKGFRHIKESVNDPDSVYYVKKLPLLIQQFRNNLAHGSCMLYPGSIINLSICADIINQIFQ